MAPRRQEGIKVQCSVGGEMLPFTDEYFSNNMLKKGRHNKNLKCLDHSGTNQRTEITCYGACGKRKDVNYFSKTQRRCVEPICEHCVNWTESVRPDTNVPLPAPGSGMRVDEVHMAESQSASAPLSWADTAAASSTRSGTSTSASRLQSSFTKPTTLSTVTSYTAGGDKNSENQIPKESESAQEPISFSKQRKKQHEEWEAMKGPRPFKNPSTKGIPHRYVPDELESDQEYESDSDSDDEMVPKINSII